MNAVWQVAKLADLVTFQRGLTYKKNDEVAESSNVVLRANNIDNQRNALDLRDLRYISESVPVSEKLKVKRGSILICTASGSKSHLGKVALIDIDDKYAFGGFMGMLTPSPRISCRFLFLLLTSTSYRDFIDALTSGMNINNLKFEDLGAFPVSFPSVEEQERIVAILDEAFKGIAIADARTAESLRAAYSLRALAAFPDEPVYGERRYSLDEICEFIVDCEHKTAPTQSNGIASIRTPNIGEGYLLLESVNRVSEETYREWTKRARPIEGDLILAREAPAGNVAVVPPGLKVCLGQRTVLLRPKASTVDSHFLATLILHPEIRQRLLAHSRGATVQHVNLKDIRALSIGKLPSIHEQRAIVEVGLSVRATALNLVSVYRKKLAALAELKQSLLQQAFSGNL